MTAISGPRETDLAAVAARTVADATAIPPDDLPDDPRAYLAWLRDPSRPVRRPKTRILRLVPEPDYGPPPQERDPAYGPAAALLATLPDLGAALIEQARGELGDAGWEVLVIRAAELNGQT